MAGREIYSYVGISWPMVICFAPVAQETLTNKAPCQQTFHRIPWNSKSICELGPIVLIHHKISKLRLFSRERLNSTDPIYSKRTKITNLVSSALSFLWSHF